MKIKGLDFFARRLAENPLARRIGFRTRSAALAATALLREFIQNGQNAEADTPRAPRTNPPPAVDPPATTLLGDHLRKIVDKRLERLVQCRRWQIAEDPVEAVHDLRVASRRLRAFVDVFRPLLGAEIVETTGKPLRRITRAARSVRDLDVQVGLLVDRLARSATDAERAALEHLLEQLEVGRSRIARRAERRLGKVDFDELAASVSAALDEAVLRLPHDRSATGALAHELLEPLIRRASADRPADDGLEYPDEMHRLRIDLKRLRYGIELFEPIFGDEYESLYARVEKLQDLLGQHHDLVVLSEVVEKHTEKLKHRQTLLVGLATLHEQLLRERRQLLARFRTEGFEPDWWHRSVRSALAVH